MIVRLSRQLALAFVLGAALAGCREDLTSPGSCPATCPGGTPVVRDTFLDATFDADLTVPGYFVPGMTAFGLRVSNGLNGETAYGIAEYIPRPDSISVRDTMRSYTIDSVVLTFGLLARDTLISGTVVELHRLPATIDSGSASYATVSPEMGGATLIDTVLIVDSVKGIKEYRRVFAGADLAKVAIAPADSGTLVLGFSISGDSTTGVRLGGLASGTSGASVLVPRFQTYVTVNVPDTVTSIKKQVLARSVEFTTYVSSVASSTDPDLLTPGGDQGTRALVRFPWPSYLKDSVKLVRATLELVPESPFTGLRDDSTYIEVRGMRVDFGAKSPLSGISASVPLVLGSADTVRVEVVSELQFWQGDRPHPPVFLVILRPEGGNFMEPRFRSTRSPSGHPRLRVTYQVPFDFGSP